MKRRHHDDYNPELDGCAYHLPCITCKDARRARAEGRWVWVVCESGSTVLSPAPERHRALLAQKEIIG